MYCVYFDNVLTLIKTYLHCFKYNFFSLPKSKTIFKFFIFDIISMAKLTRAHRLLRPRSIEFQLRHMPVMLFFKEICICNIFI